MRCLLAKLNDYLREHSVSVGYIDADPPPHFGPLGNGREKHRLARSASAHENSCPVGVARRVVQSLKDVRDERIAPCKVREARTRKLE